MLWVIGSFVLGATIAPWLYQAGKAFAEWTAAGDFPRLIESVGGSCQRAGFGRYFNRALLLAALILLPFLLRRLRMLRGDGAKQLWQKLPWKTSLIHTLVGCLIALGVLWTFASLLESLGHFVGSKKPVTISRVLSQADTVAALLVAAIIFRASMHMASDAVNMLMDSGSSQASEAIVVAVRKIAGISEVTRVRVRTSGPQNFVDLTVGVAPGLKVSDGHRLAHEAEEAVAGVLPGADVTVHVEPRKSCRIDENNPFALVQIAASEHGLAVHDVHILSADSACHIELHVELPGQMPFDRAYARVKAFEDTLRETLPGVEIVSHMEPKAPSAALEPGASVSVPFSEMAWSEIKAAVENEPLAAMPHKFSTYVLPEQGVCISFHCNVSVGLSVEEAHNVCTRLEKRIRAAVPQLGRLSIHMEPAVVSNTPAA